MDFDLCPEFQLGGVSMEYKYRIGSAANYLNLTPQQETLNGGTGKGQAVVTLPGIYGMTPLALSAYCRSARGLSSPSVEKVVTNCDAEQVRDSDGDGISDRDEDRNCNGYFDPADPSNLFNVDTDGDGVRDLVELVSATDPANPGSSPRPFIFSGAPFDPEGDGNSNSIVWRPSEGRWYIRDVNSPGNNLSFPFGLRGDVPFVYTHRIPDTSPGALGLARSDVGVIRRRGTNLDWYFHGKGLERADGSLRGLLTFGVYGDNIVIGPWELPGVSTPAVTHVFNGVWTWYFLLRDGSVRGVLWGQNLDVPKPSDYDGDGIFDVAVFRPSTQTTYIIRSTDGLAAVHTFGSPTADHTVRGDFSADGKDDIAFWEPVSAKFTVLKSDLGFNDAQGAAQNPNYYMEGTLGAYFTNLPLIWQLRSGRAWYSVVDHSTGNRLLKDPKNSSTPVESHQWGLSGDAMG